MHHTGGTADFHRLATRLSRERLACAWPAVAAKEVRPDDDTLMMMGSTPATIACLAAQLPRVAASTVVVSRELPLCTARSDPLLH